MKTLDELTKGPKGKSENYNDIKKALESTIKSEGPISQEDKGPDVKDIDTLIDYITKCDIEIPKLILALNQLLPDKKIQDAINKLLKGE